MYTHMYSSRLVALTPLGTRQGSTWRFDYNFTNTI